MTPAILAILSLAASALFGPRHVWRVPDGTVEELHQCTGRIRLDCVKAVLQRHGGTLVDPWRANENEQPALVGGKPPIVYPEEASFEVGENARFQALKEKFPNLLLWKPGAVLEGMNSTPKGQSFIFSYRLLDGCHACPVRGYARVEFLFAPDGTFRRAAPVGVIPTA